MSGALASLRVLHQCIGCERSYGSQQAASACPCTDKVKTLYECPGCKSVWADRAFVERHAVEDCYNVTDEQRAALARAAGGQS